MFVKEQVPHDTKSGQIIFEGVIRAVPSYDVKRCMRLLTAPQPTVLACYDLVFYSRIFCNCHFVLDTPVEKGHRYLKISGVGEPSAAYRAKFRKTEMALE